MKYWHLILPFTFSAGCIAAAVGAVGLWLIRFGSAWAWFWIGGNVAVWSALIMMAREVIATTTEGGDLGNVAVNDGDAGEIPALSSSPDRTSKSVCAWCKITLREGTEPPTHGICPVCAEQHFPEYAP